MLPPRVKIPKRGKLSWAKRYCDVGDRVKIWELLTDRARMVTITEIKQNRFGRVSYWTAQDTKIMVLTEELVPPDQRRRVGP